MNISPSQTSTRLHRSRLNFVALIEKRKLTMESGGKTIAYSNTLATDIIAINITFKKKMQMYSQKTNGSVMPLRIRLWPTTPYIRKDGSI